MTQAPTAQQIADLIGSGLFDASWYRASYPDVDKLNMDPAVHYLRYGHFQNRDPGPDCSTRFTRIAHNLPEGQEPLRRLCDLRSKGEAGQYPLPQRVLKAAESVAIAGDHARAIKLAETHLVPGLAHTAAVLRANAALNRSDYNGWLQHINAYLAHYDAAPIHLIGTGTLFDQLAGPVLSAVTEGPMVTVIMPAWNSENTVLPAARSILQQTWRNLELLIVDDASTDGTWKVLEQIAALDPRVRISRNSVNVGPYVSKNIALREAKGQWFTGQDADDWAHPQRIEKHMKHILASQGRIPASRAYMIRMTPEGEICGIYFVNSDKIDGVTQRCSISSIYNVDFFRKKLGFYDCSRFGADSELVGRVELATGHAIDELKIISMLCQSIEGSLTNNNIYGIGGKYGMTPGRAKYKAAWQDNHAAISHPGQLKYKFPDSVATFPKPSIAAISKDDIRLVSSSAIFKSSDTLNVYRPLKVASK